MRTVGSAKLIAQFIERLPPGFLLFSFRHTEHILDVVAHPFLSNLEHLDTFCIGSMLFVDGFPFIGYLEEGLEQGIVVSAREHHCGRRRITKANATTENSQSEKDVFHICLWLSEDRSHCLIEWYFYQTIEIGECGYELRIYIQLVCCDVYIMQTKEEQVE